MITSEGKLPSEPGIWPDNELLSSNLIVRKIVSDCGNEIHTMSTSCREESQLVQEKGRNADAKTQNVRWNESAQLTGEQDCVMMGRCQVHRE